MYFVMLQFVYVFSLTVQRVIQQSYGRERMLYLWQHESLLREE